MEGNVWNRNKRRNRYQRSWNASDTEKVYVRDRFVAPALPWWRTPRFLTGVLILILVGWMALLLWHPYFFLRHLSVEASETKNEAQYREAVLQEIRGSGALSLRGNYFLFSTGELEATIRERFPLQSISVVKKFPNTLQVQLVEKSDSVVALYGTRVVRITTQGAVTQLATAAAPVAQKVGEGSASATSSTSTVVATAATLVPVSARASLLSESKKLGVPAIVLRSWATDSGTSPIATTLFPKFIDFTTLTRSALHRERGQVLPEDLQYLVYDPVGDPYSLGYVILDSRRGGSEITYWYDLRSSFESQNELLYEYLRLEKAASYRQLDLRRPGEVILRK